MVALVAAGIFHQPAVSVTGALLTNKLMNKETRWHLVLCEGPCKQTNNAITDGGVAPPPLLLTIVMMSSNLKSLIISRNSKDSRLFLTSTDSLLTLY